MITALRRKVQRVLDDDVLRRWLIDVSVGRGQRPPRFTPHRPPYLAEVLPIGKHIVDTVKDPHWPSLPRSRPRELLVLPLPGAAVTVSPDAPDALFSCTFDDTETLLAVQRFAWLPLLGPAIEPA